MNGKFKTLASNTVIFAIGSFGSKLIMFFFLPIYTNVLSTSEYGVAELVTTFASLIVPFMSFSVGDAVLRFSLDKKIASQSVIQNAILIVTVGSGALLLFLPLLTLYEPIRAYVGYLAAIAILTAFRNACLYFAKGTDNNLAFAIDSIVNTFSLAVANIVFLVVFQWGIVGYLLANVVSLMISVVYLLWATKIPGKLFGQKLDTDLLKQMLKYSAPMILNAVSWWIINSINKIMIESYISTDAVGIYTVAAKIPTLINTVTYFFTQAWVIAAITEYDSERDAKFYEQAFRGFNCVLCIIVAGVLLILKPFMSVYVGADFVSSWQFVPLLLVASIFRNYSDFFGAFFSSAKKNVSVMLTTLAGAVGNVVLNALLIPLFGVQGAVIATAGSYVIIGGYRMLASRKIIAFKIDAAATVASVALVVAHAVFAILDWHLFAVSIVILALLVAFNWVTVKALLVGVINTVRNKLMKRRK